MRIRRLNHSTYQIQYHIVWVTKYRYHVIKPYVRHELIRYLLTLPKKYPDWYFHRINTGDDHVHMLMEIPPKESVASVVQKMKSYTSAHLRHHFKFLDRIYVDGNLWSVGYFVSTVGLNEAQIKRYIEQQNRDDHGYDVSDEYA